METPDLARIVEVHVPITEHFLTHLRRDVLPHIRRLQAGGQLRWFSFLLHGREQLAGVVTSNAETFVHLRLEPVADLAVADFIRLLPPEFQGPLHVAPLGKIAGVELSALRNQDWALAWRLVGESSEWVLCLLEAHTGDVPLEHFAQFMHFTTNPLGLGFKCQLLAGGAIPF